MQLGGGLTLYKWPPGNMRRVSGTRVYLLCQQVGEDAVKFCGRLCFSGWLCFVCGDGVDAKRKSIAETVYPVSFPWALAHKRLHSPVSTDLNSGSWTAFWGSMEYLEMLTISQPDS